MKSQTMFDDPKTAALVSVATTGTGISTVLELIPDDIGKLATVIGIILSSVLIYTHYRKGRSEYKKTMLEITILEEKESERLANSRIRKSEGLPIRRESDS